jgi:hypothetical protein
MINWEEKQTTTNVAVSVTCDSCKKKILIDRNFEHLEIFYIKHACGFNSIFEDEFEIDIQLCQQCVKKRLGDIIDEKIKE